MKRNLNKYIGGETSLKINKLIKVAKYSSVCLLRGPK